MNTRIQTAVHERRLFVACIISLVRGSRFAVEFLSGQCFAEATAPSICTGLYPPVALK